MKQVVVSPLNLPKKMKAMTRNNKRILLTIMIMFIIMIIPTLVSAGTTEPDPVPGDPESVPIDGGLSLLVAAGVGYGAKKMKERKNKSIV